MSGISLNNNLLNNNRTPFKMEISVTDNETFTISQLSGYNYNYRVNWGDGNFARITSYDDANATHTYTNAGTYVIEILGLSESIYFNNTGNKLNVTKILQWGTTDFKIVNFYGCSNLSEISTVKNKRELVKVITFLNSFRNTAITSIPNSLFDNCTLVTNFSFTFQNSAITSIPISLFDNCTLVTIFQSTFAYTTITTIPIDLFKYNTKVTNFVTTFQNSAITSIPTGLFDNCTLVTNFGSTFQNSAITSIPANLITSTLHPNLVQISNCWYGCTGINITVYEIWNDTGWTNLSHANTFQKDTNITNYADIPDDWKGL